MVLFLGSVVEMKMINIVGQMVLFLSAMVTLNGINTLSTGDLSKIASFISSLIGGPVEILSQCRFAH